ncbi:MAG: methyltransferase domain-containing protein [Chloroflexaceae bacterium]|nr:methyltransferase domain-containing protein [Chloroflexaceae bacterium]
MQQHIRPPKSGLVLEIGSGDNPHPRSDVLLDRFISDNTERGGSLVIDRPLVVADAHHLPFRTDAFAYIICSHILEHMDDPPQFVEELMRVGQSGYIGSPSEIAERLFHWSFHRWYVNLIDDTLVLHPKEPEEPFGELFDYLYAYNPVYYVFQRSMPDLFWVEMEWHGCIKLRMTDTSPLPLRDPSALHTLVQPRFSPVRLLLLFVAGLLARTVHAERRQQLRRLMGRSYI